MRERHQDDFEYLSNKLTAVAKGKAFLKLTINDSDGQPIANIPVSGITSENGNALSTDQKGVVSGLVNGGTATLSVGGYIDFPSQSKTYNLVNGEAYEYTWNVNTLKYIRIDATKKVKFSTRVSKINYSITGGGGSGGKGTSANFSAQGGTGGGGGYSVSYKNVSITPNVEYEAIVGAGGNGANVIANGAHGYDGGMTSFLGTGVDGGHGGSGVGGDGNGSGGTGARAEHNNEYYQNSTAGTNGTQTAYTSYNTLTVVGGGGGGGAAATGVYTSYGDFKQGSNGGSYGGNGGMLTVKSGTYDQYIGTPPGDGTNGGGGGGAYSGSSSNVGIDKTATPGSGGNGFVAICIL